MEFDKILDAVFSSRSVGEVIAETKDWISEHSCLTCMLALEIYFDSRFDPNEFRPRGACLLFCVCARVFNGLRPSEINRESWKKYINSLLAVMIMDAPEPLKMKDMNSMVKFLDSWEKRQLFEVSLLSEWRSWFSSVMARLVVPVSEGAIDSQTPHKQSSSSENRLETGKWAPPSTEIAAWTFHCCNVIHRLSRKLKSPFEVYWVAIRFLHCLKLEASSVPEEHILCIALACLYLSGKVFSDRFRFVSLKILVSSLQKIIESAGFSPLSSSTPTPVSASTADLSPTSATTTATSISSSSTSTTATDHCLLLEDFEGAVKPLVIKYELLALQTIGFDVRSISESPHSTISHLSHLRRLGSQFDFDGSILHAAVSHLEVGAFRYSSLCESVCSEDIAMASLILSHKHFSDFQSKVSFHNSAVHVDLARQIAKFEREFQKNSSTLSYQSCRFDLFGQEETNGHTPRGKKSSSDFTDRNSESLEIDEEQSKRARRESFQLERDEKSSNLHCHSPLSEQNWENALSPDEVTFPADDRRSYDAILASKSLSVDEPQASSSSSSSPKIEKYFGSGTDTSSHFREDRISSDRDQENFVQLIDYSPRKVDAALPSRLSHSDVSARDDFAFNSLPQPAYHVDDYYYRDDFYRRSWTEVPESRGSHSSRRDSMPPDRRASSHLSSHSSDNWSSRPARYSDSTSVERRSSQSLQETYRDYFELSNRRHENAHPRWVHPQDSSFDRTSSHLSYRRPIENYDSGVPRRNENDFRSYVEPSDGRNTSRSSDKYRDSRINRHDYKTKY